MQPSKSETHPLVTTDSASPGSPRHLAPGQKLAGCYVLQHQLGVEGEAEIWAAQDEVLGKAVSLHFIPTAVTQDVAAMNEVRQEVKRNRQLIHPNILRVYDLVEEADWAALSMDAFQGQPLSALLREKGALSVDLVQPWVAQICDILEQAHKIQVFHRDLAPENVFLNADGKVLLGNFGISRVIQDALRRADDPAAASGRLASLSPQLLEGQPATKADDVYGVGALTFHLLTGSPVFTTAEQIQTVPAPRLSERLPEKGNAEVQLPAHWEEVVAASLSKEREARPQEIGELQKRFQSPAETVAEKSVPEVVMAAAPAKKPAEVLLEKAAQVQRSKVSGSGMPNSSPAKETSKPASSFLLAVLRSPVALVAGALLLLLIVALAFFSPGAPEEPVRNSAVAVSDQSEPSELTSVNNPAPRPAAAVTATPEPIASVTSVAPADAPLPKTDFDEPILMAAASPTPAAARPRPASPAPAASVAPDDRDVASKATALEKLKAEIAATEKALQERAKQQQAAAAALAEAEKTLAEKTKTAGSARKAGEEIVARRKKMEEDQLAAETAAQEAQKLAAQKAQAAEEARKVRADFEKQNKDKLAAQEKADAEIAALQQTIAERQKTVAEGLKASAEAEAAHQQRLAAVKQTEQEVAAARMAAERANADAEKKRQATETERRRLDDELMAMRAMFDQKMKEIEDRRRQLESGAAPAVPAPSAPPSGEKLPLPPTAEATRPTPTPGAEIGPLAMKTEPKAVPTPAPPVEPAPSGSPGLANQNSLGMTFAPVGDVLFSIWQTRVKDFEVFAKAVNLKSTGWRGPGFRQGADHPVVNVSWNEAVAFCKWLTDKERKEGVLAPNQFYRLPYDLEWSKAVGLPEEAGKTPEARDMGVADVYPWGTDWPPPAGAGNYTGEETGSDVAIRGYNDGFAWTAPVGSFAPNKLGLFDMGGNVWQWCMDSWSNDSKAKVLRGASWYNGALKLSLLSSCRVHAAPDSSTDNYGFRIVRATESGGRPVRR